MDRRTGSSMGEDGATTRRNAHDCVRERCRARRNDRRRSRGTADALRRGVHRDPAVRSRVRKAPAPPAGRRVATEVGKERGTSTRGRGAGVREAHPPLLPERRRRGASRRSWRTASSTWSRASQSTQTSIAIPAPDGACCRRSRHALIAATASIPSTERPSSRTPSKGDTGVLVRPPNQRGGNRCHEMTEHDQMYSVREAPVAWAAARTCSTQRQRRAWPGSCGGTRLHGRGDRRPPEEGASGG